MQEVEQADNTDLKDYKKRHREAFKKYRGFSPFNLFKSKKDIQHSICIGVRVENADSTHEIYEIIYDEYKGANEAGSSELYRMLQELHNKNQDVFIATFKIPLQQLKDKICQHFIDYTQPTNLSCTTITKRSFFGHHHNKRAHGVIRIIHAAESPEKIRKILGNQKKLLEGKRAELIPYPINSSWDHEIKNRPSNPKGSAYYGKILAAIELLNNYQKQEQDKELQKDQRFLDAQSRYPSKFEEGQALTEDERLRKQQSPDDQSIYSFEEKAGEPEEGCGLNNYTPIAPLQPPPENPAFEAAQSGSDPGFFQAQTSPKQRKLSTDSQYSSGFGSDPGVDNDGCLEGGGRPASSH